MRSRRLAITATLVVASVGTPVRSQTPDPLDALFARARTAHASRLGLTASFTETTVSSLLRAPIVATGTVKAVKPLDVLMEYSTPEPKTLSLDANRLVVTWPGRGERQEVNITEIQRRIQKYFVDASPSELRQSFDIVLGPDPERRELDLMVMTPKRKQIREGLTRLQLWIERDRLVMVKMRMEFPGGDSKTLEFQDIKINPAGR